MAAMALTPSTSLCFSLKGKHSSFESTATQPFTHNQERLLEAEEAHLQHVQVSSLIATGGCQKQIDFL